MASVAQTPQDAPEWRKSTEQGPNPRQRRTSTREGNRGNKGGRGRGRGGNGGGPPRKDSTSAPQDAPAPATKVVVDPPTTTNTPAEPSPSPNPNSRPKPAKRNSATVSEDSNSVSSQTSARPPNRRGRSQQGRRPSASSNNQGKHLNVQNSSRKASSEPSSPNPAKDLPPHIATAAPTTPATELKNDIDALVTRVRAVAMDRPHTPGSHIDWADDDDSLPSLNDWGYTAEVTASAQPEEPQTVIPPILEDEPLETVIPEVKVEGEPSPDEAKPQDQDTQPGPVSNATPPTHKVQKTRSKRGGRSRGDSRMHQTPPALNLTDAASQDLSLSPIQPTPSPVTPHTGKPQGPKRPNQGQNSRNNQGRTNPRDNSQGNGGGRQRGQNGATAESPMRNSFPPKTGPKANRNPAVQSQAPAQGPDIAQSAANRTAESDSRPTESKGATVPDKERKEVPAETLRKLDTSDPNPNPTTKDTLNEQEPAQDDVKPNSPRSRRNRNSYNPSHSRSHTYGGRTQGGPPHSASTPNFPHHSSDANPTSSPSRNPRPSDTHQSPGTRSSGPGSTPKSAGFERHNRNHSSPPGVGSVTRQPHSTRPVIAGSALTLLAKTLGSSTPASPKKDPPVPPPTS